MTGGFPSKGPVTRKMFPFDDVTVCTSCFMIFSHTLGTIMTPKYISFNVRDPLVVGQLWQLVTGRECWRGWYQTAWFQTAKSMINKSNVPVWLLLRAHYLTHWGRMTHICVSKLTIIGSDNGLSPGRRQAIIWTNAGILLIGHWGTTFSEILIGIQTFSFKKMHLKMSSAKWCPFSLGLNV